MPIHTYRKIISECMETIIFYPISKIIPHWFNISIGMNYNNVLYVNIYLTIHFIAETLFSVLV